MEKTKTKLEKIIFDKGLKQRFIAEKTGIAYQLISDYVRGRHTPKAKNMKKIADFLGMSVDEVFFD